MFKSYFIEEIAQSWNQVNSNPKLYFELIYQLPKFFNLIDYIKTFAGKN